MKRPVMKRWYAVFAFLVVLSMVVSACTVVAPSAPGEAAPAKTRIVFYQRGYVEGGTDAGSVNTAKAIEIFEQKNPDIDVEIVGIPWTAEGDTKLETALAGGSDINIFRVTSPNLPRYAKQGILSEITPYLTDEDKADFYESAFQVATVDGKVWAWPLWVTAISLFANTDILAERGIELPTIEDPWTWDEFVAVTKQLTFTRDDGTQVYGFTSSSKWGAVEYYPLMYIDGGRILSPDGKRFVQNEPEGVSALEKIASLALEHKVTPPDFGTVDQATVRSQFKEMQSVALLMSTPGFIPDLENSGFPLAVLPPPTGDLGRLVTNGAFGLFAVVDVDDKAKVEAAHRLARYLTSSEVAQDVEGWQLAPGLRRSNMFYATTPNREVVARLVEYGIYEAPVATSAELGSMYGAALQAIILGEKSAQQAMDEIAPLYQAELDALNQ
ncbi:sugar ABC transporter substrate-binding protein [Caldilinea sp.]|jgi:multiple sugar transport system substrate-binding protein|uniref:ABC transporter substrate-binding protein n=1 Tax=Caldilinea sp. TaxID=2293560 RepID=UPI001B10B698|nr:sugar ABC transporter substrate-binding protein [Caldilinea sp.]MBO9394109.1 sugar ABC transporter substrate-binding protein [Caldilinea sp.]